MSFAAAASAACDADDAAKAPAGPASAPAVAPAPSAIPAAPPSASGPAAAASASEPAPLPAPSAVASASPDAGAASTRPPREAAAKPREEPSTKDAGVKEAAAAASSAPPAPSASAAAEALDPAAAEGVAADVDRIYAAKKTYRARFKQEHTQKVSGVVKTSSGLLSVEKPDKLSFRYDPPNLNRVVSDGRTLTVYLAEDNQAYSQPVDRSEYPGALSFIMGHGMRDSFTFTFHPTATFAGGPVLVGKPKVPNPSYETVLFYIDDAMRKARDPGTVRRVLILDVQGNKNRFDFEGATQPDAIDPAELVWTPPPGVTVTSR